MRKFKVAICRFPGDGWEQANCTTWLMMLNHEIKSDPRIERVMTKVIDDTPITMSRNRAVKYCRALGIDYILMIDNDMEPDYLVGQHPTARPFWKTAWEFMMARRAAEDDFIAGLDATGDCSPTCVADAAFAGFPPATIAAPYCGPPPDECCYVFHWKTFESNVPFERFRLQMIEREDAAHRSGVQEVAALPTGLILYDARVFDRLDPPWFDYEWEDPPFNTGKATTEDVYQTRNASMLKMPQYCLWDAWAIHWKWKGVRKPDVLHKDQVHSSLVKAVERGWVQSEKLHFQNRYDAPPVAPFYATTSGGPCPLEAATQPLSSVEPEPTSAVQQDPPPHRFDFLFLREPVTPGVLDRLWGHLVRFMGW